ncbi:ATP synthase F1 subunit epsilon [Candidatus Liberibacter americanus]|uniref:ATP synthase epsilon chain n=1 Tax=Candidatus Liberibacter americanus str. Sao Paulo TaxID=1261131 RepID=U6B9G5_9HYPH|nr:ATP synthase F1 subunit epsilon [Candidatus Liberibacter americanus]AHA28362.1 F0F1-type ATP synthase epsilon subunit [Candidatus Liberibacter americanus str. Sao Paulo]EMS36651.1 ATP synthase F0F1 subunit epsilon [Candidatus Liberibacter americanus PW_SP]
MSIVNSFCFELVSPEKCVFSGEVKSVVLPSENGDITILSGHSSVLSIIRPGIIIVELASGDVYRYVVVDGIADASSSRCTVLSENIFPVDELCIDELDNHIFKITYDIKSVDDVDHKSKLQQLLLDLSLVRDSLR